MKMEGSGVVKLNLKALDNIFFCNLPTFSSSSCNFSFTHFRFQPRFFLSSTTITATAHPPKSNFLSSRFSPLCTLSASKFDNGSSHNNNKNLLQVVLVSPQIPGNTGSIARTCAASGVKLHLVEPLGFTIDDTKLKRAGLDYWPYVVVKVHPSWAEFRNYFLLQEGEKRLLAFTKRGIAIHSDFSYRPGDWLVFGSETTGLPPDALLDCKNKPNGGGLIKIPMVDTYVRCLNLSVSVGIAVYEAARQLNYKQLQSSSETYINSENPLIKEDIFS